MKRQFWCGMEEPDFSEVKVFQQDRSKLYPDTVEKSLQDMPVTMGKKIKMDNDYYADCVHNFGTRRLVTGGDNLPGQNIFSDTARGRQLGTYLPMDQGVANLAQCVVQEQCGRHAYQAVGSSVAPLDYAQVSVLSPEGTSLT